MTKQKMVKLFESRKGHLDYRINRDYVQNGIATIPCRIYEYNDVISRYSGKGYETLNPEFFEYLKTTAELTPPDCPLVLDIIGNCLSNEEKETIKETIRDDLAYDLGIVEKDESRHTKVFRVMFLGMLISGLILYMYAIPEVPREALFILFWFMGETVCDHLFMTGHDLRKTRQLAGRLASIKVIFSDSFETPNYTDSDVNRLYSEIEKDVKESIKEEG